MLDYVGGRIRAEVEQDQDGIVVHGSPYVRGWRAAVDEKPVPLLRIDGFLQGAIVPKGRHLIQFWYEPNSFVLGAGITLISAVIIMLLLFWPGRKQGQMNHLAGQPPSPRQDGEDG